MTKRYYVVWDNKTFSFVHCYDWLSMEKIVSWSWHVLPIAIVHLSKTIALIQCNGIERSFNEMNDLQNLEIHIKTTCVSRYNKMLHWQREQRY